jgi:hypothetical protein
MVEKQDAVVLYSAISFCYKEYVGINEELLFPVMENIPNAAEVRSGQRLNLPTHCLQDSLLMLILSDVYHSFLWYVDWKFKIFNLFYSLPVLFRTHFNFS